jgi:hypothetical protein
LNPSIDIDDVGFERGAHLLIKHALRGVAPGSRLAVSCRAPDFGVHLLGWCRAQGHRLELSAQTPGLAWITPGDAHANRWHGAERAGAPTPSSPQADGVAASDVADHAAPAWGLAARGALVEAGGPDFGFSLDTKRAIWADDVAHLYAQAQAQQWNPDDAIDWTQPIELPDEVEDAVVQVMTYLIENENAALLVPARFLGQVHPHFREVTQLLAIQIADEARHIEVFTRRAQLKRRRMGVSTVGGQASLKTLFDETEFAVASFLLSVLGEGTFVSLLHFLQEHAPDPVTRQIARLTARDEARHVAFGMAHLEYQLQHDPELRGRLALAVQSRFDTLAQTAGLNEEVFDALVLLAAGGWSDGQIASGFDKVQALKQDMAGGRQMRMKRLGFELGEARRLAALHTRNFM